MYVGYVYTNLLLGSTESAWHQPRRLYAYFILWNSSKECRQPSSIMQPCSRAVRLWTPASSQFSSAARHCSDCSLQAARFRCSGSLIALACAASIA